MISFPMEFLLTLIEFNLLMVI